MSDQIGNISNSVQKKAFMLTAASFVNTLISLLSGMIIPRMLSTTDYATYRQTFLAFNTLLPFLGLGLSQGLYFFLPSEKKRVLGTVLECYAIYGLLGFVFAIFLICGGNILLARRFNNPAIETLLLWQIPYAFITLMTSCTSVVMNIRNRINLYIKFNIFCSIASTGALVIAVFIAPNAKTAVIVITVVKVIEGFISIYLSLSVLPHDDSRIQWSSIKRMVMFSFPIGVSNMIGTITSQMDLLFIAAMRTTEEYAQYTIGATEVPIIGVFLSSVSTAILPDIRGLIASKQYGDGVALYRVASRRLMSITFPIMCFLMFWADEFVAVLYSEKYLSAVPVFRVYLLYFLSRIALTGPVFTALGMNKYLLIKTIVSCALNAILTYVFIIWFGAIGAAIGTITSGWIIAFTMIWPVLGKRLGVRGLSLYPFAIAGKLILLGFITAAASYFAMHNTLVPQSTDTVGMIIKTLAGGIIYLLIFVAASRIWLKQEYVWLIDVIKRKAKRKVSNKYSAKDGVP
jgi:O-antigen/teichoic acid export membrane protein